MSCCAKPLARQRDAGQLLPNLAREIIKPLSQCSLPLPKLCDEVEASWRAGWPLMTFLCDALGVDL